jgi:nitrate reductase NapE component
LLKRFAAIVVVVVVVVVVVLFPIEIVDIAVGTCNIAVGWVAQMITWSEPGPKTEGLTIQYI